MDIEVFQAFCLTAATYYESTMSIHGGEECHDRLATLACMTSSLRHGVTGDACSEPATPTFLVGLLDCADWRISLET